MFDVKDFILAVKERPALYNPTHQYYNRKDVRAQLWDEIGRIMYPEWENFDFRDKNEKGSLMQKKWKSLKDCFNREIRLQKTEDPKKSRKKYEFYEQLSFLRWKRNPEPISLTMGANEVRIKLENVQKSEEKVPNRLFQQSEFVQNSIGNQILEGNLRKRKLLQNENEKLKQQRKLEDSEDGDKLFLMSFVDDLKKLPLATKYWVKMKFSEIMHQAAMSLDGNSDLELADTSVEYDVGSPSFMADYEEGGNSPDSSSSEVYICQN